MAESRGRRKRRTRGHVIADLSANHVERYILRCGFSAERMVHDYGIDLLMFTYRVPVKNRVDKRAIRQLGRLRDAVLEQVRGVLGNG